LIELSRWVVSYRLCWTLCSSRGQMVLWSLYWHVQSEEKKKGTSCSRISIVRIRSDFHLGLFLDVHYLFVRFHFNFIFPSFHLLRKKSEKSKKSKKSKKSSTPELTDTEESTPSYSPSLSPPRTPSYSQSHSTHLKSSRNKGKKNKSSKMKSQRHWSKNIDRNVSRQDPWGDYQEVTK